MVRDLEVLEEDTAVELFCPAGTAEVQEVPKA